MDSTLNRLRVEADKEIDVLEWSASALPATWRTQVDRWEHLNTLRTWAAVVAFISLSVSLALGAQ